MLLYYYIYIYIIWQGYIFFWIYRLNCDNLLVRFNRFMCHKRWVITENAVNRSTAVKHLTSS